MHKVDILVFSAHPDDAELCIGGTILKAIDQGHQVGLCDLTAGELGSNGSVEIRAEEARLALEKMGAAWRVNLGLPDGFFRKNESSLLQIARIIRIAQPNIVLLSAPTDRHPDHGRSADLIKDATFYSGLVKIDLFDDANNPLPAWRPKVVLHYVQDIFLPPDIVIDITTYMDKKLDVLSAYGTQFYPKQGGVATPINDSDFIEFVQARAREMGRTIGVRYGEGFIKTKPLKVEDFDAFV